MRALLLLAVCLFARSLWASEHVHVVAAGETLESLAKAYYGAGWKAVYLETRNGVAAKDVAAGKRIVVPGASTYKVRKGDSATSIAKRYLGNDDRYKVLVSENGLKSPEALEVGQELVIPMVLKHITENGENLSAIARRYYRSTKRSSVLRDYNGVEDVKQGDRVWVPIFDRDTLDPKSRKPEPPKAGEVAKVETPTKAEAAEAAKASDEPQPDGSPESLAKSRSTLRKAVDQYRKGELKAACSSLEPVLAERGLGQSERVQVVSHLGFCAVAAGDRAAARDYFKKWLELDPKAQLDPIMTSPKILDVFYEVSAAGREQ